MPSRACRKGRPTRTAAPAALVLSSLCLGWSRQHQQQLFAFPPSYYAAPSGVFNPAGVLLPSQEVLLAFRWDRCFYQRCGVLGTRSTVLISKIDAAALERDERLAEASHGAEPWAFSNASYRKMLLEYEATAFSAGDFRPFLWRNEVYLGHFIKFGWSGDTPPAQHAGCVSSGWGRRHACARMALSRLDFAAKELQLVRVFPAAPLGEAPKAQKNWAFLEDPATGELLVLHSLLPCTTVFVYSPDAPGGLTLRHRACYEHAAAHGGLRGPPVGEISQPQQLRLSGHPIQLRPWQLPDPLPQQHSKRRNGTSPHSSSQEGQQPGSVALQAPLSDTDGPSAAVLRLRGCQSSKGHDLGEALAPKDPGARHLAMGHVRLGPRSYAHWGLLLGPDLLPTHITAEPVLHSADSAPLRSPLEGHMPGVLTVGSFHITGPRGGEKLLVLLGEGDQFSRWARLPHRSWQWQALHQTACLRLPGEHGSRDSVSEIRLWERPP